MGTKRSNGGGNGNIHKHVHVDEDYKMIISQRDTHDTDMKKTYS